MEENANTMGLPKEKNVGGLPFIFLFGELLQLISSCSSKASQGQGWSFSEGAGSNLCDAEIMGVMLGLRISYFGYGCCQSEGM